MGKAENGHSNGFNPQSKELIKVWANNVAGKPSRHARVAPNPLVQMFVQAAQEAGFDYPALLVKETGIRHDTLHQFVTGKSVPVPETMVRLISAISPDNAHPLWDLYGCELRRGKGSFRTIRGTESARIAAANAHRTRRFMSISNGKIRSTEEDIIK